MNLAVSGIGRLVKSPVRGLRTLGLRRSDKGQALVEFAIILPLLVLLALGSLEVARAYVVQRHMNQAVELGARAGAVKGASLADVSNALSTYLSSTEVGTNYSVTITGVDPTADFNSNVTVTVEHNLTPFTGIQIPGVTGSVIPLSASITMRHQ